MPFDLPVLLPRQDRVRGQFGAIVRDHHTGIAPQLCDPVQFPRHTMARDRRLDDGGQALPAEVVDDAQDPEPPTPGQAVGHGVEGPALAGSLQDRHRCAGPKRPIPPATLTHRQPCLVFVQDADDLLFCEPAALYVRLYRLRTD